MKKILFVFCVVAMVCGSANALTTFTGAVNNDFNNAANWDNGLPTNANGPGEIPSGKTATMTANYLMANDGNPSVTDIIVNGILNTSGYELQSRSGTVARQSDIFVGDGAGKSGILNVDSGGRIDIAGAGADVLIGTNGGLGTVNFLAGSFWQISKALEVRNGTLSLAPTVTFASPLEDELVVDNGGTLVFEIDGATVSTIKGSTLALQLGSTSTLEINLTGTYSLGDSWTLIDGISSFSGVFGNVTSDNGLEYDITYDSAGGNLIATLTLDTTSVVATNPEPYDGEAAVEITRQLSWSAPGAYTGATYDVYFGSNADVRSNTKVIDNEPGTNYDPPVDLLWGTTYYWVVDSYAGQVKHEGTAWSFTTGGQATDPSPADGQLDVEPIGMASWTGDGAIASYDIYFAASGDTLISVANTADTTVSMNVLAAAIGLDVLDSEGSYQWRVDALDSAGALMKAGDLWTFTVRAYTCQDKIQMGFKKRVDMDNNCSVDILDLAILAQQWLLEYNPN